MCNIFSHEIAWAKKKKNKNTLHISDIWRFIHARWLSRAHSSVECIFRTLWHKIWFDVKIPISLNESCQFFVFDLSHRRPIFIFPWIDTTKKRRKKDTNAFNITNSIRLNLKTPLLKIKTRPHQNGDDLISSCHWRSIVRQKYAAWLVH